MQTDGVFVNNNVETKLSSDAQLWDTRLNSRMKCFENLNFQTTFFYRGKQEITQGMRKAFCMLNASISKDIRRGSGTLTFNVQDVLNSRKFRYKIDQPDLISQNELRWSGQQFRLTFVYRLK